MTEINPTQHNPCEDLQSKDPEYQQIEANIDSFWALFSRLSGMNAARTL
jgi:hypothetical protein